MIEHPDLKNAYLNEQGLKQERDALRVENERLREALEETYNEAWLCDGHPDVRVIRTRVAKALGVDYPYAPQEIDPPR